MPKAALPLFRPDAGRSGDCRGATPEGRPGSRVASRHDTATDKGLAAAPARAGRKLEVQAAAALVLICLLFLLPLLAFGALAVGMVDRRAESRENLLIASGLDRALARISHEQERFTSRIDAPEALQARDDEWIEQHLARALYRAHGHDRIYVLDPDNRPVYAMEHGQPRKVIAYAGVTAVIGPMAQAARRSISGFAPGAGSEAGVRDVVRLFGHPHVVSIRPIHPETGSSPVPEETFLHVVAIRIDTEFLRHLGETFELHGIRLVGAVPPEGYSTVPLRGSQGVVANLAWKPERPGTQLVQAMKPAIAVVAIVVFGAITALAVGLVVAMRQLDHSEVRARSLAQHDALTGLANRASFNTYLRAALLSASDRGTGVAVFYIDLDGFKEVNDTLGHAAGDAILKQVGARLLDVSRQIIADAPGAGAHAAELLAMQRSGEVEILVARLGGDEFTLVQTGLRRPEAAESLAQAVLDALRAPLRVPTSGPAGSGSVEVSVGASIGIAISGGLHADSAELMRRADVALYAAKASGRGGFVHYDRSYDERQRSRHLLDQDLRAALSAPEGPSGGGFQILYQPIFDTDGAEIRGAEALLRWVHPKRGQVSPADFVPVAEERGLMGVLGAFVLSEACRTAKACELPWVAVNVSAAQFRSADFADRVLALLDEAELSPSRLQLEITETLLLDGSSSIDTAILKLRIAGVRISLDDFGTGYSSLSYLTRYRVDKIKIDRSFVSRLDAESGPRGQAADSAAVVRVVLDLARALSMEVTAEGVETEAQWMSLRALGAEAAGAEMQGFLFARPIPADELIALVRRRSAAA